MTMDFNPLYRNELDFYAQPTFAGRVRNLFANVLAATVYVRGGDFSHHQGTLTPSLLKSSGLEFAILKATEDVAFVDPTFSENWQKLLEGGFEVLGTYHFMRQNFGGASQANHHLSIIQPLIDALDGKIIPPFGDVETADGATLAQIRNRTLAFNQTIENNFKKGGDYSSPGLWSNLIGDVDWAQDYFNWVAHWTSAPNPVMPVGWSAEKTKFWQYGVAQKHSWVEPIQGTESIEVDANRFFGTMAELKEYVGIVPDPPDEELQKQIDELKAEIDAIQSEIENIKLVNTTQNTVLSQLSADVTTLSGQYINLDNRLTILEDIKDQIAAIL